MVSGIFIMAAQTNQTIGLSTFYHFESHVETFSSLYSPHIIVLNIYSHMLRTMQHRTIIFASTIKHNFKSSRGQSVILTYILIFLLLFLHDLCFRFASFIISFSLKNFLQTLFQGRYGKKFFFFWVFSRAAPTAYGDSQARGLIGAVAAGLCPSHSNTGSKPRLQPTPQLTATPDP